MVTSSNVCMVLRHILYSECSSHYLPTQLVNLKHLSDYFCEELCDICSFNFNYYDYLQLCVQLSQN